uniref:Reverse transcriptase domain-containing protein n=1 Tax=Tanacetum cinerariifolium TaxID=118510 RepID=A0A6L2KC28_TANCI|nr:hypothetical protein [Tanacetum cinerariifolium]
MNYFESNPCYDSNYFSFDQIEPQHYAVNPSLSIQNERDNHELFINELIQQKLQNEFAQPFLAIVITLDLPTVEPEDSLRIGDEHLDTIPKTELDEFIKSSVENLVPNPSESEDDINPSLSIQNERDNHELFINELIQQKLQNEFAQPFLAIVITLDLPTVEPEDSLRIGDEHLDTIPKTELDEFIKSSVENLVPNPSESEDDSECDVPACDDFTTFSNLLFDADDDFSSSVDKSFSDENISKEIYSNPLVDEEIIYMKIDPHHFNAESNLIESLLNHDSSIISSSLKIDSLLDEFAGELILLKSIPPGIDETSCDPEEEIHLIERLLYDNPSPRPPKEFIFENSDATIESFSPSHIPVEDSDSLMEEIDLTLTPDDSMPSGIEEDYDSERDMLILEELLSNNSLSLPENKSFHFDIPSSPRPLTKPSDDNEIKPNSGMLTIKMCLLTQIFPLRPTSSQVPVPLPKDHYEAIRQAYLVGTDTESEPFEGEAETSESPHIVAPPTCHVEESEGSSTSGVRSTSSDSTASLSLNHPLTHTTADLVPLIHRTARMAVHVPPVTSPDLSADIAEVAAMSDSAFCKRFRCSYDSSPLPTLPVRKRYRGTSELILDTNSEEDEEVEEVLDSDSVSEDAKDKGPTAKDEDPAVGDEGLAARDNGLSIRVESRVLDDEGHRLKSDGLGLQKEEDDVHVGQQHAASIVGTTVSAPLGLGYGALRRQELALREDHVYSTFELGQGSGFAPEPERSVRVSAPRQPTLTMWTDLKDDMVYIDVSAYPPPAPPAQTLPSPKWSTGLFPISPAPSIVPSPISSPMISMTDPSLIASLVATSIATIQVDEDQFIEVGAQLELYRSTLQDHTHRLDAMPPTLPVLALEAWVGRVDTLMTDMSREGYDDHRLLHDMLLQQTTLQRELQEMKGRFTALEQERDRKER